MTPQKMLGEATEKYAELTLTEKQYQGQKSNPEQKKSAMMQHLVPARPHGKNSRLRRVQSLPLKAISQQQNPVMVPPNLA